MSLPMSSRFVLGVLALFSSTAWVDTAGWSLPPFTPCPFTTLDGCECFLENFQAAVNVTGTNDAMDSCLTQLSESGHTMVARLYVQGGTNLNLTADFLKDVQVKSLYFESVTIVQVDENFLGNSSFVTTDLVFNSGTLEMGIPKINGEALTHLVYNDAYLGLKPKLSKKTFSGNRALEYLKILSAYDTPIMPVARNVFRYLTQLREVYLQHSVSLKWDSLFFTSPQLETITLGNGKFYTLDIGPGSISGVPVKATLLLDGTVTGGWQPSKVFNLIQSGVNVRAGYAYGCDCDKAWIRYSGFIDKVYIKCENHDYGDLDQADLTHCQFYQNLNKVEP